MPRKPDQDLINLLVKWRQDPVAFVKEAFEDPPEPDVWQKETLNALVREDRLAIKSGHGIGKTAFLAWAILWFALTRYPYKIPCTAPSSSQLMSALWPELGKWYRNLRPALRKMLRLTSDRLELASSNGTSFAEARTSRQEQPEALQGFHEQNLLFIVDEASGVPDIIFEVGSGSLTTEGAKILMTGNPTRTSGYFYDIFHPKPGQRRWWTRTVSCLDAAMVDPTWVEEMKAKYGEDSPQYAVRVLGEFPKSDEMTFIPAGWIEEAVARRKNIEMFPGPVIWGVDVGWQGDRSAVAKRQGGHLVEPITWWSGLDPMQTAHCVVRMYEDARNDEIPKEICVDVIGLGAGVYARLKEEGLPVTAVNVANTAEDTEHYRTRRHELWGRLRDWFQQVDTTMPDDEELINELRNINAVIQSSGKIWVESKEDTRKRIRMSPDLADSLMLTFAASSRWERGVLLTNRDIVRRMPTRTEHAHDPRRW